MEELISKIQNKIESCLIICYCDSKHSDNNINYVYTPFHKNDASIKNYINYEYLKLVERFHKACYHNLFKPMDVVDLSLKTAQQKLCGFFILFYYLIKKHIIAITPYKNKPHSVFIQLF
jgi:homoserine acetyltransferase